ncbi:autophagy-related protein 11-domain-containing protein [Delphinella strobiligena]|nr:autophagy-related protein 11-domain-containing protein [Delphinella strobiligena]
MSLVIYIAHSGDKVAADPSRINSLEALRGFVDKNAAIPPNKQVFLTSRGKQVRVQTLLTEDEIHAFDSSLLTPLSSKEPKRKLDLIPPPTPHEPGQPPDTITNQTDLQSWWNLFEARLGWAISLRDACAVLAAQAQKHAQEQRIIETSLGVAVMSLTSHMHGAESKHATAEEWSEHLLKQQETAIDNWERDVERLARIPGRHDFATFVQAGNAAVAVNTRNTTLQDFVHVDQVNNAGTRAKDIMTSFARRVVDLRANLTTTAKASNDLLAAVENIRQSSSLASSNAVSEDEAAKLMEEIDIIVNKMRNDLDHVSTLPTNSQGVSRASKMALLHTRNYLPNLSDFCGEINDLLRRIVESRNAAAEASMSHMQTLASIESRLSQIYADIKNLDISAEDQHAFNILNTLSRLPYAYGSLLIEAVRRKEWASKMKQDSNTLAEEMATYQEEEARRRKKWLLSIDDVVNPDLVNTKASGLEINLQSDDQTWPAVSRQEVHDYLNLLDTLHLPAQVVQELSNAVKDLDRPTKKQVRLARTAFKNGSVHDATFGAASLMLRGGDEQKLLRDVNTKLEEELRGQKSRVRKLEDLLHRQANLQRLPSSGESPVISTFSPNLELVSNQGAGTPPMPGLPFNSRLSEDAIRHASIGSIGAGSRRASTTFNTQTEEKKLARRIVTLEAELQQSKEHSASLEKEKNALEQEKAAFEHEKQQKADDEGAKKAQLEEAVSTKKDIMKNMEAQQKEFTDERRVLKEELRLARERLEEIEDEMERVIGSRNTFDTRTKDLEHELDQIRLQAEQDEKSRLEEIAELTKRVEDYRQRDEQREEELQRAQRHNRELIEEQQQGRRQLITAHNHLSPQTQPPEKRAELASVLENLAERSAAQAKELSETIEKLRSEKQSLQSQHDRQSKEFTAVSAKHAVLEDEVIRLRDEMVTQKAHAVSLSSCLNDEREQLRDLRSRIATGEAGADDLRKRVEEEEGRVVSLTDKLGEAESHTNSLEVELVRMQEKSNQAHSEVVALNERLEQRGVRAKEVTQKLYAQNTRLIRLLDQLGFVVAQKEDGTMMIERASKVNNAASTILDRSILSSSPPQLRKPSLAATNEAVDPATLSFLHWSECPDPGAEETAFAAFLKHISVFDHNIFSDSIAKRLRDFEYTARKWSKEAKSYSTLSARLKHENNQKIAVRDFKEGDLALFLPTRGELGNKGAWAAFNIGAPHHFLREREGMGLGRREWLVARISRVEERVVDLKNGSGVKGSGDSLRSVGSTSVDAASLDERRERDDDNPFELSDGLTWYLVHASEDKSGAPSTPGLGKVTVASSTVGATGNIGPSKKKEGSAGEAVKKLGNVKSMDSRRSSEASRKSVAVGFLGGGGQETRRVPSDNSVKGLGVSSSTSPATSSAGTAAMKAHDGDSERAASRDCDQVRRSDLLFGP